MNALLSNTRPIVSGRWKLFVTLVLATSLAWPAWGALSFNSGNGTVTDSTTGLVWDQCVYGLNGSGCVAGTAFLGDWASALAMARQANSASYKGFSDWRVPNKNELESIARRDSYTAGVPSIDTTAFPNTPISGDAFGGGATWTSTSFAPNPSNAWIVNFDYGYTNAYNKTYTNYVRLVRSGQSFASFDTLNPSAGPVQLTQADFTAQTAGLLTIVETFNGYPIGSPGSPFSIANGTYTGTPSIMTAGAYCALSQCMSSQIQDGIFSDFPVGTTFWGTKIFSSSSGQIIQVTANGNSGTLQFNLPASTTSGTFVGFSDAAGLQSVAFHIVGIGGFNYAFDDVTTAGLAPTSIPASERAVLLNLYNSTNGASWTNKTNWNGAAGTECTWYGITCDRALSHVTGINLGSFVLGNHLVGTLPSVSDLTALQSFTVDSNQLTGSIPALSGLTALKTFSAWGSNQLTGSIPSLSGLTALENFQVPNNRLTGSIPSLSGLTALQNFDVGGNLLTGSIPSLSGLTALHSLRVDNNRLTGSVPAAPTSIVAGSSALCSNSLITSDNATIDAAWVTATGVDWLACQTSVTPMIAAGADHAMALKSDGTLMAWGRNDSGQLGDGTSAGIPIPRPVREFGGVNAVATGGFHTLAIDSGGTAYAWGYNGNGQIGDGTRIDRYSPVAVPGLSGVVAVAAGERHSVALKSDGTLMAWGDNSSGQLGTATSSVSPVPVPGLTGVVAVAANAYRTAALLSDGTVVGLTSSGPLAFPGFTGVVALAAGYSHIVALKSDGTVLTVGQNTYGQLGGTPGSDPWVLVPGLTGVVSVTAGYYQTLALKADGTVMAWGRNDGGQLGDGSTTNRFSPVPVSGLSGVLALSEGAYWGLALKSDSTMMGWGYNDYGELGDGTQLTRLSPVAVTGDLNLGTVAAPLGVSPTALTFAAQNAGSSSAAQTLTLSNTGSAALSSISIVSSGDYARTTTCGLTLEAGASCTIDVTFTPTAAGTRVGAITIVMHGVIVKSLGLSGTGVAVLPICTLSANPTAVAPGGASTLTASCNPAATSYVWTGGTCAGTTAVSCTVTPSLTTTYSVAGITTDGPGVAVRSTVSVRKTYSDNADGTVTDPTTGLQWMRCAMGQTWDGATATCTGTASSYNWDQAIALTGTFSFAGQGDWRVPNIRELTTIADRSRFIPAIDVNAFPNTSALEFWSASAYAYGSGGAWDVNFYNGSASGSYGGSPYKVRLVRAGQSFGTLLNPARPGTDYVDQGNGTVAHTPTSLIWQRCAKGQTWSGSTCTGIASFYTWDQANALTETFASQSDWRVPTIAELETLLDYTTFNPALNSAIFPVTSASSFWSASANTLLSDDAWNVYFDYGSATNNVKSSPYQVRLVRAGQSFNSFTLTVNKTGNGAVNGSALTGIACGSACNGQYTIGTTVILSALPAVGNTFTGWSGACTGMAATCTVTLSAAKSVTAAFVTSTFAITTTASPLAGGTVNCTRNPVSYGDSSTCTVTPNAGYIFTAWSGDCSGATCVLSNVTAVKSVTATFTLAVPVVSLNPTSLTFTEQNIGTTSGVKTVRLTNTGTAALSITGIAPSLSVFVVTHDCGASLAPGGFCTLSVSFKPVDVGTRVGLVTVGDNAVGNPHNVTVSGVGVPSNAPICSLNAAPARIQPNRSTTLTASCSPAATSFTWTGGTCAGKTTATCTDRPAVTTTYSVTGTNSYDSSTASTTVTVNTVDLTPILMLLLD